MKQGLARPLQPRGCIKAFKGKGDVRRRLDEIAQQLSALRRRMRQLRDETRAVRGRTFALETYVRRDRDALSLRWRFVLGRHGTFSRDIEPALAMFPVELETWYRRAHTASLILNTEERVLRFEQAALRRLNEALGGLPGTNATVPRRCDRALRG